MAFHPDAEHIPDPRSCQFAFGKTFSMVTTEGLIPGTGTRNPMRW
jgi:hypothetical protein